MRRCMRALLIECGQLRVRVAMPLWLVVQIADHAADINVAEVLQREFIAGSAVDAVTFGAT